MRLSLYLRLLLYVLVLSLLNKDLEIQKKSEYIHFDRMDIILWVSKMIIDSFARTHHTLSLSITQSFQTHLHPPLI